MLVNTVGHRVSQALASSASSMVLPVSARRGHRRPASASTTNALGSQHGKVTRMTNECITIGYNDRHQAAPTTKQHSALAHNIDHVVWTYCPMRWKTKVRNFDDINDNMLVYVNSNLHQYFQTFDDPQVALEKRCLKEFKDQENWVWLCSHFQALDYMKKAKANKINREKKTLLHHSGLRPFSGFKIPGDRCICKRLCLTWGWVGRVPSCNNDGEEAIGSSGIRLPTSSQDSDRVRPIGKWESEEIVLEVGVERKNRGNI
ncbi:hypothetical protein D8674_037862 [Pyrus ussuriensis x Pyrus communis]|uniref:Uncharacterized protein n=1 Tax=Pyrus ussuriensis x Pyrus communis TaxID=2448454 RepID=A0A5N5H7E5_9ROSA|nr:hypothetical protein D8674_037862 [Pyrus ussuriensis x Pyrus communis]